MIKLPTKPDFYGVIPERLARYCKSRDASSIRATWQTDEKSGLLFVATAYFLIRATASDAFLERYPVTAVDDYLGRHNRQHWERLMNAPVLAPLHVTNALIEADSTIARRFTCDDGKHIYIDTALLEIFGMDSASDAHYGWTFTSFRTGVPAPDGKHPLRLCKGENNVVGFVMPMCNVTEKVW